MSFELPYICKKGRYQRFIHMPDFYLNFVSSEDASQIYHGLKNDNGTAPSDSKVRESTIKLARQRRGGA